MGALRVLAFGLVFILVIALVAPWDPGQGGGWGARAALAIGIAAAVIWGWMRRGASAVAIGAAFGFTALALFSTGCYVAYDLGSSGVEWSDWGDQNHPVSLLLLTILLYGIPAAVVGAILAELGRVSRRLL
jgi:hypothetical protein